jgi:hypothetical protein
MTPLTSDQWWKVLTSFKTTAHRWEQQPFYDADAPYVGSTDLGFLEPWVDLVRSWTAAGQTIARVRVHESPPTEYQQWARWVGGQANEPAGEALIYLPRAAVEHHRLEVFDTDTDWWLLDGEQLLTMRFDDAGTLTAAQLTTDDLVVARAELTWQAAADAAEAGFAA